MRPRSMVHGVHGGHGYMYEVLRYIATVYELDADQDGRLAVQPRSSLLSTAPYSCM